MISFSLSETEKDYLNNLLSTTDSATIYRRAQSILWLDQDWPIQQIALELQVTRQTVSNWRTRFLERRSLSVHQWFPDDARSGRPRIGEGILEERIREVIGKDPRDWGYQSTSWTAPLLAQYLQESHHLDVAAQTVRRALARLDLRWKRPRHELATRSPTWRQAKGG